MRILFVCGREVEYPRNLVLLHALQSFADVDVIAENRSSTSLTMRSFKVGIKSLPKIIFEKYDLIFVGFYGYLLFHEVHLFSSNQPIVFDAFLSNFDTLINDRAKYSEHSIVAKLAYYLDRITCSKADMVLLDTNAQIDFFNKEFSLDPKNVFAIPVGSIDSVFYPRKQFKEDERIHVLSYSSYLPLHGMEIIIYAASLLQSMNFEFKLIGNGQQYENVCRLVKELKLTNVLLLPPVPLQKLPDEIASADICLGGHFGITAKANRTIPGKIYQMLAMGRPIIAADSIANRELLTHKVDSYLCPTGNPEALALALKELGENPNLREQLGNNARNLYIESCSEQVIAKRLSEKIKQLFNPNLF